MRVYSSIRKLRIQRDGKILVFADGKYDIEPGREPEVMALLKGVDPKEAVITNNKGEQINIPNKIEKKALKSKKKKEVSDAYTNSHR